jgi:pyrroline-5-carboxylate reductase
MQGKNAPPDILAKSKEILRTLGDELFVADENYVDMATAISGSGPAYVFLTMEAMVDAAVHLGFPRNIAQRLVVNTIRVMNAQSCDVLLIMLLINLHTYPIF